MTEELLLDINTIPSPALVMCHPSQLTTGGIQIQLNFHLESHIQQVQNDSDGQYDADGDAHSDLYQQYASTNA